MRQWLDAAALRMMLLAASVFAGAAEAAPGAAAGRGFAPGVRPNAAVRPTGSVATHNVGPGHRRPRRSLAFATAGLYGPVWGDMVNGAPEPDAGPADAAEAQPPSYGCGARPPSCFRPRLITVGRQLKLTPHLPRVVYGRPLPACVAEFSDRMMR